MNTDGPARREVELAARRSYGRLVAYLATRTGDIASAEDALADAFVAALRRWPESGVPDNPEAWLLVAARRRLIDARRDQRRGSAALERVARAAAEAEAVPSECVFPDERLGLMFACAHPAIDPGARTPLMLQAVLGLEASTIASAFLVAPAAMAQRLVRAKAKIREAGVPIAVPEPGAIGGRVEAVLDAIYAAFGTGWDALGGADAAARGLAEEAVELAGAMASLRPDDPEALGLLALVLFCHARRDARRGAGSAFVPLDEQPWREWDWATIARAERALSEAFARSRPGPYQFEAAIQSAHVQGLRLGRVDWPAIRDLYAALLQHAPSLGASVAHAAAIARAESPEAGLATLDALGAAETAGYQPAWAVRAELLSRLGRVGEARAAYGRAVGLTEDRAVRAYLLGKADALAERTHPGPGAPAPGAAGS